MAGGKETPRQKMIGMMYLVLTALLALNVSKEIINAFVKLNDKLEDGQHVVDAKTGEALDKFEAGMIMKQTQASTKPWKERADKIHKLSYEAQMFILNETNDLLKAVDGAEAKFLKDSTQKGPDGKPWKYLSSLMAVNGKDKYDEGTHLFVGGDPKRPNERGQALRKKLETLRDQICSTMSDYNEGKKTYKFDLAAVKGYDPQDKKTFAKLDAAVKNCNPADQQKIKQVYRTLSYPEVIKEYGEEMSWQAGMFDHAPSVAACAMFTTLRGDIKTAEAIALEHLTTKLEQPLIKINKIEPMAFARTGYLNTGDTMDLKVMIAAYDSTDVPIVRYDMGAGEQEIKGAIKIKADSQGEKEIKGTIGVKQKGELVWKPWSFRYEVGQPMGVISPIEMNVLYAGYDNKLQATASGFPNEKVTLSVPGATCSKGAQNIYTVRISAASVGKTVVASVSGAGKQVGKLEFRVRSLPKPGAYLGSIPNTESRINRSQIASAINAGVRLAYDESIPLKVAFRVTRFELVVQVGAATKTLVGTGGALTAEMRTLINQLRPGASLTITGIRGAGPSGEVRAAPIALVVQ
jgi:gliding motility-associated protein GldM